jgi:hypothetical protein
MGEAVDHFGTSPPYHHSGGHPMHPHLCVLRPQSTPLGTLGLGQRRICTTSRLAGFPDPVPERPLIHAQVPGDLSYGLS